MLSPIRGACGWPPVHLKYMIESGEDLEKTLVTLSLPAMQRVRLGDSATRLIHFGLPGSRPAW